MLNGGGEAELSFKSWPRGFAQPDVSKFRILNHQAFR
jgi:hypothetical protein